MQFTIEGVLRQCGAGSFPLTSPILVCLVGCVIALAAAIYYPTLIIEAYFAALALPIVMYTLLPYLGTERALNNQAAEFELKENREVSEPFETTVPEACEMGQVDANSNNTKADLSPFSVKNALCMLFLVLLANEIAISPSRVHFPSELIEFSLVFVLIPLGYMFARWLFPRYRVGQQVKGKNADSLSCETPADNNSLKVEDAAEDLSSWQAVDAHETVSVNASTEDTPNQQANCEKVAMHATETATDQELTQDCTLPSHGAGKLKWAELEEDDESFMMNVASKQLLASSTIPSAAPLGSNSSFKETCSTICSTQLAATIIPQGDTAGDCLPRLIEKRFERKKQVSHEQDGYKSAGGIKKASTQSESPFAKILACGRSGNVEGVLTTAEEARASCLEPVKLNNATMSALLMSGDADAAAYLFENMKQEKRIDVASFNIMLRSHLESGRRAAANRLMHEMEELGFSANAVTVNQLLKDRSMNKDRCAMWRILEKAKASGLRVNPFTCSIMFNAITGDTSKDDVKKTFALLDELTEQIDEVLCSSVIEACLRTRDLSHLSKLRSTFKARSVKGLSCATFGAMIKAYSQVKDVENVWATWNMMLKISVIPSSVTVGCMVDALVANDAVDEAWRLVHNMLANEKYHDLVNTVIYSTILKGFAQRRSLTGCFAVLDDMRAHGLEANTITYNTVLDCCVKSSALERVPEVFQDMRDHNIDPDMITYSTMVKGLGMAGDLDRALDLFDEMKRYAALEPDEIIYNSLLDACARQKKVDQAVKLLHEMLAAGISPSNYTLSILVKMLGRARRLNDAFDLLEEFRMSHGVRPNMQVYTCLCQACFTNRQARRALSVHDSMVRDLQRSPDIKAYNVLLEGCLHAGHLNDAIEVTCAAYRLPGHKLALPDSGTSGPPVGVDRRLLDKLGSLLRTSHISATASQKWERIINATNFQ